MGLAKARKVLLKSRDRKLENACFSKDLLESGVKNPLHCKQTGNMGAMRKLHSYSDKELIDPGISRGSIPHVVMFARDGISWISEFSNRQRIKRFC